MMKNIFNIIGFQVSWWGCVLGVKSDMTYLGPLLMLCFLTVHIVRFLDNYSEIKLIILFGIYPGPVLDLIHISSLNLVENLNLSGVN